MAKIDAELAARRKNAPSDSHPIPTGNPRRVPPGYNPNKYPKPSVTCDTILFMPDQGELRVLLIQRRKPPYEGYWAIPGGFLEMDEDLGDGAKRELQEETGLKGVMLEQLGAYGAPDRDPRTRVITIAYVGLVSPEQMAKAPAKAADDAMAVGWFSAERSKRPPMAFDHDLVLDDALAHVRRRVLESALAQGLLPREFSALQLRRVAELICRKPLDTAEIKGRLLDTGVISAVRRSGQPLKYRFVLTERDHE